MPLFPFSSCRHIFWEMLEVKHIIESRNRSPEEKKKLVQFVVNQCQDEGGKQWLQENSESEAIFDLFHFLQEEFDKEKTKTDCKDIDIIFVAHGEIKAPMFPARCLLPLPSIRDVLLYSPWNCTMSADVVYGVATGRIQPEDRVFSCGKEGCHIPDSKHQPDKLPNSWNSMREAGGQKIPNIIVSTLRKPEDGVWKRVEYLNDKFGRPEKNRIVITFSLPGAIGPSLRVPFSVITLALSLVLHFSSYKATVHLAACLGRREGALLSEDDLKTQYACAKDKTVMTPSKRMWLNRDSVYPYRVFKALFG